MLKPETNEKLQDVAFDIEQALKAIGENPSSYDLGLFEGKMIGLSVMLNAVACEIERYCEHGDSESTMAWIPYEGGVLNGHRIVVYKNRVLMAWSSSYDHSTDEITHYLKLPELPKQEENVDAKS